MTVKADDSTGVDWNDATANERERVGIDSDTVTYRFVTNRTPQKTPAQEGCPFGFTLK